MIIKARAGTGGPALARYLEQGKNDHAELLELRNMDAPSLKAALYRMDALAQCNDRCQKHALHVQMRAAPGERLTAAHWREAVDRYAEAFGLQEHQAAVILHHQPDGATHCHVVFNRVHPETLKAAHLSKNYETHKQIARNLEREWGLRQVGDQTEGRNYSDRGRGEQEQAKRVGENVHEIRAMIRGAWEASEDGRGFVEILGAYGLQLATGDRRDFVAVDRHGNPYSLGKRTTGASAQEVREKLADLGEWHPLETVRQFQKEAEQIRQREAQKATEAARELPQTTPIRGASRPDRAGLPQRPTQRPPPTQEPAPEQAPAPAKVWSDLEAQRKAREKAESRYRVGFKTRLREDLTAMRRNPDHIGASNPNDPAKQAQREEARPEAAPSGKTRAERRAEELRQQTQGQERTRRPPRRPGPR